LQGVETASFLGGQLVRVAEAAQQVEYLLRVRRSGLADLAGDGGARPRHEPGPFFRAECPLRRVPQTAEVIEHALLGAGVHGPILPHQHPIAQRKERVGRHA
jgi:hypothetical protein